MLADFVAWKISMIRILFVALARINVFSKPVLDLSVCVASLVTCTEYGCVSLFELLIMFLTLST